MDTDQTEDCSMVGKTRHQRMIHSSTYPIIRLGFHLCPLAALPLVIRHCPPRPASGTRIQRRSATSPTGAIVAVSATHSHMVPE